MDENNMNILEDIGTTEIVEVCTEPETTGGGIFGKIIVGTLLAGAAAAAVVWHKTKDKREAKKIEKLRAKGYTIYEPCTIEESDLVGSVEEESDN